jgi:hypothetical protein
MRTIHVYRAAHHSFVDGIYWGDEAEGVQCYLQVTGVPPEEITKALAQVAQEGTYTVETGGGSHARARRASAGGQEGFPQSRSTFATKPTTVSASPWMMGERSTRGSLVCWREQRPPWYLRSEGSTPAGTSRSSGASD